jgi:protein ImuB
MNKRFISLFFPYLKTDWLTIRQPGLRASPVVLSARENNRVIVTAANAIAEKEGIYAGGVVADARAIVPTLTVVEDKPGRAGRLLRGLGEWCIRFTPLAAVDGEDGLVLDVTGCPHLWGGEAAYLREMQQRLETAGYTVRAGMADSMLAAWAVARFGRGRAQGSERAAVRAQAVGGDTGDCCIVAPGRQLEALSTLPPMALRLEPEIAERLLQLGLSTIDKFVAIPRRALRRRFGPGLLQRLDEALGREEERLEPICPVAEFSERLPSLEPIQTRTGIEIALQRLLNTLCRRLQQEGKGLRACTFRAYRIDGKVEQLEISTTRATHQADHLFSLFGIKLQTMEPALGIELFLLEAPKTEDVCATQTALWSGTSGLEDTGLAALLDRFVGKFGAGVIHRYVPEERYWPERSIREATDLRERPGCGWRSDRPRPVQLLSRPEPITVTAPIPDYPPMLFRYKGMLHTIARADGPERIEREWWIEEGPHRDYYAVEDEEGRRYWLFRSGHYRDDDSPEWFIHGFFA